MMTELRYHIRPRDAPADVAGRLLGLTEAKFADVLPALLARGFPQPDPTTGLFDLDAIEEWRRQRHPHLFLTATEKARDARAVVGDRIRKLRHG